MTHKWNSNDGVANSAAGDLANQDWGVEGARLVNGVWSVFTDNASSTDPAVGAPIAWGAREVGARWLDTGVDGTAVSPVLKRWQDLTGAGGYGWRTLRLRKRKWVGDPTLAVVTLPGSPAAADIGWTTVNLASVLNGATPGDVQDAGQLTSIVAEVKLQLEVKADAAEVITDATKGYLALRGDGLTGQDQRLYAEVAGRPNQGQMDVQLVAEKLQYKVVVGTGAPAFTWTAKIVELQEWI